MILKQYSSIEVFQLPAVSFAHSFQQMVFPPSPDVSMVLLHHIPIPDREQEETFCHVPDSLFLKIAVFSSLLSSQYVDVLTIVPGETEPPESSESCEYVGGVVSTVK